MFNNNNNKPIPLGQGPTTNNIFNNNNSAGNNVFNNANNGGSQNNPFFNKNTGNNALGNNNSGQGSNVFNNSGQGNNVFNNPSQGNNVFNNPSQGNNPFPAPNNTSNNSFQQNNIFNKGPQNNAVSGGQAGQGNNIFNKGAQGNNTFPGQNNVFNNGGQGNLNGGNSANNVFNQSMPQNNGQNNFLNPNAQQQNNFNHPQQQVVGNYPQNAFYQQVPNLINYTPQQQQQIVRTLTNDQIRRFIENCIKSLPDTKHFQILKLPPDNVLKNQKISKVATTYNIKPQILHLKKEVRDKVTNPIGDLKSKAKSMSNATAELAYKVSEKLQKYKERLIQAITQKKMIEDVRKQVDEIDSHIRDFIKPLFTSYQSKNSFSFIDPDQFCLKVAEKILKNISYLDNKMDELLACQGESSQQVADTGDVIEQLVVYYQNVVISLRQFAEKYSAQKKKILEKQRMGNTEQTMRNIMKKANSEVTKELRVYELVKQIENILIKREKSSQMIEQ